jgi:hypothetical protein
VTPKAPLHAGGHTAVIQRVLERRAEKRTTTEEGTTATVAVMVRVLPPPKALLVFQNARYIQEFVRLIAPGVLDYEAITDEPKALRRLEGELRPVIVTDSLEFVRRLGSSREARTPFVIYDNLTYGTRLRSTVERCNRSHGFNVGANPGECAARP